LLVGAAVISSAVPAGAVTPRPDAIWARSTAGSHITLDGVMDEPAWGNAESVTIHYGYDNGIPGSGWKDEGGHLAKDSTNAVLKFLVDGNSLYVGFDIKDKSVGGSVDFNRFDGILMALKDHNQGVFPAPPAEYFYSWWFPDDTTLASTPGLEPCFRGVSPPGPDRATIPCSAGRTATEIANWDAKTYVHGLSNSDAANDTGYTIEMKFNLTPIGYNVTQPQGDVIEWNCSVYDVDWNWPLNLSNFSTNRSWIQSPWGNAAWYDELHIYARPDVTINSGPLPKLPFDLYIPAAGSFAKPTIDGALTEPVWANVPGFDIRWNDDALRASYPEVGKWRGGQYQPAVNGGKAQVFDPADATVKMFTKEDTLYIGFDVRDQVVQYHPSFDRWDGAIVTITDRIKRWTDHNLQDWRASFQVSPTGTMLKRDDLPYLADTLRAVLGALQLKPGTTVDTLGQDVDQGYTAELAFDLTKFGYPDGLGDRQLFLGIDLLDGDSYVPFSLSYGTRTWWYRQYNNECCPATVYMDPSYFVLGVGPPAPAPRMVMLGASPNPFSFSTRIRYALSDWANVSLEVYDVLGRQVSKRELGLLPPGEHDAVLGRDGLSTSMYLVRLRVTNPVSGVLMGNLAGKVMHLK
jgi:hypothetical protein